MSQTSKTSNERPQILEGAALHYAPSNELGVVFLFAEWAKKRRIRVESIQAAFPDCIAYMKTQRGERKVRIEFEFKSRSFKTHRHHVAGCDWIVCWEHNWVDAPSSLEVIELRKEFGLGFNVWVSPVDSPHKEKLASFVAGNWSVPSQANKGDLQLFYLTSPEKSISYVYKLQERAAHVPAGFRSGMDYRAEIRRVAVLEAPVFLEDLRSHRILSTAGFVRSNMRTRHNATEYWPYLYDLIINRNPKLHKPLSKFSPSTF
jgi:hypothetical protein